jgi:hypothetical protein
MSRTLFLEPGAEADILEAHKWYEDSQPGLGTRFVEELDATFSRIREYPAAYQAVAPAIHRAVTHVFP